MPAKLAARVRVLNTGHGRKTEATDALSVATAALHHRDLRRVTGEDTAACCGCCRTAAASSTRSGVAP